MTEYSFICQGCKHEQDFEHSMQIGPPKEHRCPECDGLMLRNYCSSIIIPPYFNETNNSIKYGKSPSEKKHNWAVSK